MSGVWMFKDGVTRLVPNLRAEDEAAAPVGAAGGSLDSAPGVGVRNKVLVYNATNETITSTHEDLEAKLLEIGWQLYNSTGRTASSSRCTGPAADQSSRRHYELRQYHKSSDTLHLISLPLDFSNLRSTHMYDIVMKTRSAFKVRDA
ncbi:unnamed protein product [Sphagnum jensenii]|jgi:hypothetical protein|uniref:Flowering-promoting factor 1-like protein 1 n=1 Tax=Sphagnum jensenii TaxID=128206 RepID=A0ABP1BTG9_9BRYO